MRKTPYSSAPRSHKLKFLFISLIYSAVIGAATAIRDSLGKLDHPVRILVAGYAVVSQKLTRFFFSLGSGQTPLVSLSFTGKIVDYVGAAKKALLMKISFYAGGANTGSSSARGYAAVGAT